ncbi:hypothetical protein CBLAS_1312 [Campylobacter blaseri]|nr:hypothetical protein CBLAS_1312 [Campylobacter blaseri]
MQNFSNSTKDEIDAFYKKYQIIKKFKSIKKISQLDLALKIGIKSVAFLFQL